MLFSILWYHTVRTLLLGQFAAIEPFLHQWRNFDGVTVMVMISRRRPDSVCE